MSNAEETKLRLHCLGILLLIVIVTIFVLGISGWSDCMHHAHGLPQVIECAKHGDSSGIFTLIIFGLSMLILLWIIIFILCGTSVACFPCNCFSRCCAGDQDEQDDNLRVLGNSTPRRIELGMSAPSPHPRPIPQATAAEDKVPWWYSSEQRRNSQHAGISSDPSSSNSTGSSETSWWGNIWQHAQRLTGRQEQSDKDSVMVPSKTSTFVEPVPPYEVEARSELGGPRLFSLTVPAPTHPFRSYRSVIHENDDDKKTWQ